MTTMAEGDLESPDIARLVRRAADGDLRAWERLVDQYARLIWSITGEFKLAESDAADVAQTTWLRLLEHIDRIEYPDRAGFLAGGDRAARVPAQPGGAQEGGARPRRHRAHDAALHEPRGR